MIFHSHANKTHFYKKGCALGIILKMRVFGTRKWPIIFKEVLVCSETGFLDLNVTERIVELHTFYASYKQTVTTYKYFQ